MSRETSFWSRRKTAVQAEQDAIAAAHEAEAQRLEDAALEERPDEEILAELSLPDPETLGAGDDFSAFMAKAVPDRIRRRALRVLWRTNPVLANVDSLVDYGEDFTDSALVVENLQTAYHVGKGMLKHIEEMARQAEAAQEPDPDVAQDELEDPAETQPAPETMVAFDGAAPEGDTEHPVDDLGPAPRPRRMSFTIEEIA